MNWLNQLYNIRDNLQNFWNHPGFFLGQLQDDHVLLLEVLAILLVSVFLLYLLFKPSKKTKKVKNEVAIAQPTVQKANAKASKEILREPKLDMPQAEKIQRDNVSKTVKAVQEETRQRQLQKQQEEARAQEQAKGALQELSGDEEQALVEAIELAGKQALAEMAGAPHQVEFFEEESAARDAAKKMFSRTKEENAEASAMQMPLKKALPPKLDFLMLYYMAPRSQTYKVFQLFKIFEDFNLYFNEDNVFEYSDQQGLQFYIASAVKPGTFDVERQGEVPGLSFIIDLQRVQEGRGAFNKMLIFIDALSKQLKGDILDNQRQRMTSAIMNEYLVRIKNFNNAYK